MSATSTILAGLLATLDEALSTDGPLGALGADTFARYDGEPSEAVDEHVVSLAPGGQVKAGASVLVGFFAEDVTVADESGVALASALRPSVVVVVRRSPRQSDPVAGATADAERLDALYDAAALACAAAGFRLRRGVALAGDARDWFGRSLVVEARRASPSHGVPSHMDDFA